MQIGEEREMTIGEFLSEVEDGGVYEIDTPEGWVQVRSLVQKPRKACISVTTTKGRELSGSVDHLVLTEADSWIPLSRLQPGDRISTASGFEEVSEMRELGVCDTLDLEVDSSRQWYYANGVVSHNTGKSSVVRAVGQQFDLPINSFDLSTFSNEDFSREWNEVLSSTPCIMLIEDVDAVFDGRVNRGGEGGLTFDCLLNCLSGVKESNGVLVVITTNHPECLDEALGRPSASQGGISTRPGRIDYVLELGPLDEACRLRIAQRILEDCPQWIDKLVQEGDDDTGAQFQNRCEQVALAEYWSGDLPGRQLVKPPPPKPGEIIWTRPAPLVPQPADIGSAGTPY